MTFNKKFHKLKNIYLFKMRKKTLGLIRNLNYKFFQYSKEINEQRNLSSSIDIEKQGSS